MKILLRLTVIVFLLTLGGCSTLESLLSSDVSIETKDGNVYECVTDMKTCTKSCKVMRDGLIVKQTFPINPDVCKIPASGSE